MGLSSGKGIATTAGGLLHAGRLALIADTGIGFAATKLATQASTLEGMTVTGNILIANTGDLQLGSNGPSSLQVTSSGAIDVSTTGSLTVKRNLGTAFGDIALTTIDALTPGQDR